MRYSIRGFLVKSENAAKPIKQQNKEVLTWIASLPSNLKVLDYGCGKFRYAIPLSQQVEFVHAVDSGVQLSRKQIINNQSTTLMEYARRFHRNISVFPVDSRAWINNRYDIVLCSNVLSAIPSAAERIKVLNRLRDVLKPSGYIFLCIQYRNSSFTGYKENPNASRYFDGWIIRKSLNCKTVSFYGLISPARLIKLCQGVKLQVINSFQRNGSVYVFCKR